MAVKIYKSIDELPDGIRCVIVVFASLKWATDAVEKLSRKKIHPILFGFRNVDSMYSYSCVTPSYTKSMFLLTSRLLSENKGNVAFLGYNGDSLPDRLKLAGTRYAAEKYGVNCEVFGNLGNISDCLKNFEQKSENFAVIVCANDIIAVILRSSYSALLKDKNMCSCSGMKISEFFQHRHPTCTINFFDAGAKLAELYLFLSRCTQISSTVIQLDMEIYFEDARQAEALPFDEMLYSKNSVDFYGDKLAHEVDNIDKMLLLCDETDLAILKHILNNVPYETIAELENLALNTVKYRVRAMLKNAELESRKQLVAVLKTYGLKF